MPNLRETVTFQRRGAATPATPGTPQAGDGMGGAAPAGDGMGGSEGEWADLCGPFRAELRPINGREEVLAGKLSGVQPYELTVRYFSATAGVTTDDRAVDRCGTPYDITAIQDPTMRRQWLSMIVKKGVVSDG